MTIDNNYKLGKAISDCREHCECGHVVYMSIKTEKCICKYCGRVIVNNSRARFRYLLLQQGVNLKEVNA